MKNRTYNIILGVSLTLLALAFILFLAVLNVTTPVFGFAAGGFATIAFFYFKRGE